jgi:hypothetical protein
MERNLITGLVPKDCRMRVSQAGYFGTVCGHWFVYFINIEGAFRRCRDGKDPILVCSVGGLLA